MDQKIKVLFLDIDNTLLDFDAGAAWAMNLCFEKAGLTYRPEMFVVFKEENNKIWRRIELGELTMDDLFYVRWQTVLRHLGLTADGVEMDVQQTIDAGLVIHHDYMIDLHTDISGKIYDMTMGDLKELDFGSWKDAIYQDEKIATLQEAMELCKQMPECTVHLELKSTMDNDPDFVPRVLEVLRQTEMVEQVILVSFNHALLRQAKQLLPELRVGALVYGELESMLLPPPIIWKDLGLTNGMEDMEAMDAALPESAADEENCSWMTRWMTDKVSMLRANFPGESLNEIYKNLMAQRDLPGYIRSLDFVPEWVSCEYHTAYKNAGFIDKLHEMGIKVSLWTVDTEDSVRSLLRTGADAYITNRPDRVREWVEKEQAATAPTETATAESAPTAEADTGTAAAE